MKEKTQQCIAGNLRYLRTYYGYTQDQLADLLHISRSSYAMVENGFRLPKTDLLVGLSKIYHIRPDIFFETDSQVMIREVTLNSRKNKQAAELIDLYCKLSPFSQGCLFEKASALLIEEKKTK